LTDWQITETIESSTEMQRDRNLTAFLRAADRPECSPIPSWPSKLERRQEEFSAEQSTESGSRPCNSQRAHPRWPSWSTDAYI